MSYEPVCATRSVALAIQLPLLMIYNGIHAHAKACAYVSRSPNIPAGFPLVVVVVIIVDPVFDSVLQNTARADHRRGVNTRRRAMLSGRRRVQVIITPQQYGTRHKSCANWSRSAVQWIIARDMCVKYVAVGEENWTRRCRPRSADD